MVERQSDVKALSVKDVKRKTLFPIIKENIELQSKVNTDEFPVYNTLDKYGFQHNIINHKANIYRIDDISTNTIEGFFSQLKRTINGTHIHVSKEYLQNYVNECAFRYNNRKIETPMFDAVLDNVKKQ